MTTNRLLKESKVRTTKANEQDVLPVKIYTYLTLLALTFIFSFATAATPKEWTIYIHMNADNSLCKFGIHNFNQIKSLDVSNEANIIIAFDCDSPNDSRLIEIQGQKEIDLFEGNHEFDMGDIHFFQETAMQVFARYPANKRMIIIWNHGSGWTFKNHDFETKGVSYDDDSGHNFSVAQLGEALKAISSSYPIELIGFDACLMQMIEVSYEYSDYVKYTIGSEDVEPATGWNYNSLIQGLAKHLSTEDIGKSIIDSYNSDNSEGYVTLSLINNQKIKPLANELGRLVPKLKQQAGLQNIIYVLPSWEEIGKDLGSFLDHFAIPEANEAKRLYQETVLYSKSTECGTGLGIYLTWEPNPAYKDLNFSKDTGWYDFLSNIQ